ncbi:hypothetical protein BJ912DRAFT_333865 [Pholiota molesta]|nr:hypothetical protein BJ912DRAFT_333865 [Pholiota molesta]
MYVYLNVYVSLRVLIYLLSVQTRFSISIQPSRSLTLVRPKEQRNPITTFFEMKVSNDTANTTQTLLPGFGRPLNYNPSKTDPDYIGDRFPSALSTPDFVNGCMCVLTSVIRAIFTKLRYTDYSHRLPLTTIREFVMLQFMNTITDKPDWHIKVLSFLRAIPLSLIVHR